MYSNKTVSVRKSFILSTVSTKNFFEKTRIMIFLNVLQKNSQVSRSSRTISPKEPRGFAEHILRNAGLHIPDDVRGNGQVVFTVKRTNAARLSARLPTQHRRQNRFRSFRNTSIFKKGNASSSRDVCSLRLCTDVENAITVNITKIRRNRQSKQNKTRKIVV